jgi:hypothetical protein
MLLFDVLRLRLGRSDCEIEHIASKGINMATEDLQDDDRFIKELVMGLVDLLEVSLRNFDSAIQVAMMVPDWKQRYTKSLEDELLTLHTKEKTAPIRAAVAAALEGRESGEEIAEALRRLQKPPN